MQDSDRQERFHRFEQLCRERGLPVTVQRRYVLEALLDSDLHPSAEQLFQTVKKTVPRISLATVYRVLDLLVDMDLARKTCSPGSQCRYDAKVHRHHHLVCLSCDRMVDLEDPSLNDIPLPDRKETGFRLVDYSVQFRGTCPDCMQTQNGGKSGSSRFRRSDSGRRT